MSDATCSHSLGRSRRGRARHARTLAISKRRAARTAAIRRAARSRVDLVPSGGRGVSHTGTCADDSNSKCSGFGWTAGLGCSLKKVRRLRARTVVRRPGHAWARGLRLGSVRTSTTCVCATQAPRPGRRSRRISLCRFLRPLIKRSSSETVTDSGVDAKHAYLHTNLPQSGPRCSLLSPRSRLE